MSNKQKKALLVLENGLIFTGKSIGYEGTVCGEVVFNTAMTGYQEMLSDPSYHGQILTFTCPHIGNVGVNFDDYESCGVAVSGVVMRYYSNYCSNWRSKKSLSDWLKENKTIAIAEIDTRYLTHLIRDNGMMVGCITTDYVDADFAISRINCYKKQDHYYCPGQIHNISNEKKFPHVILYDFGVKLSIIRQLKNFGCYVTIVSKDTPASQILKLNPDGVLLSNGPGDPAQEGASISIIRGILKHNIPIFGICFGHQLLALACGGRTKKMKYGHHGANHPVIDLESKRIFITSQNHGYVVDEDALPNCLVITHRSLFDQTIQGICHCENPAFGFQGHPEASPGPEEATKLFSKFLNLMTVHKKNKQPANTILYA